ncbi:MAG: hypothetical protein JXR95_05835 [Deltaproteobacteria bacterium]|nr:hypothetical protein [Deltaproteobacteria bacterium]
MNTVYSNALTGLARAGMTMYAASSNISRSIVDDAKALEVAGDKLALSSDTIDLSREAVAMMQAENFHAAQIPVIKTADEMTRSLLDILA